VGDFTTRPPRHRIHERQRGFYDVNNQPHNRRLQRLGNRSGQSPLPIRPIPEWKLTADALAKLRVLVIPDAEVLDSRM